jgi:polyhydroxyalkanoate synthase subunit PhaE
MDSQMEKMFFVNLPVATRSEMDEVYKNLYDLKKMYRNLERMFSAEQNEEKTAKKTSKKK